MAGTPPPGMSDAERAALEAAQRQVQRMAERPGWLRGTWLALKAALTELAWTGSRLKRFTFWGMITALVTSAAFYTTAQVYQWNVDMSQPSHPQYGAEAYQLVSIQTYFQDPKNCPKVTIDPTLREHFRKNGIDIDKTLVALKYGLDTGNIFPQPDEVWDVETEKARRDRLIKLLQDPGLKLSYTPPEFTPEQVRQMLANKQAIEGARTTAIEGNIEVNPYTGGAKEDGTPLYDPFRFAHTILHELVHADKRRYNWFVINYLKFREFETIPYAWERGFTIDGKALFHPDTWAQLQSVCGPKPAGTGAGSERQTPPPPERPQRTDPSAPPTGQTTPPPPVVIPGPSGPAGSPPPPTGGAPVTPAVPTTPAMPPAGGDQRGPAPTPDGKSAPPLRPAQRERQPDAVCNGPGCLEDIKAGTLPKGMTCAASGLGYACWRGEPPPGVAPLPAGPPPAAEGRRAEQDTPPKTDDDQHQQATPPKPDAAPKPGEQPGQRAPGAAPPAGTPPEARPPAAGQGAPATPPQQRHPPDGQRQPPGATPSEPGQPPIAPSTGGPGQPPSPPAAPAAPGTPPAPPAGAGQQPAPRPGAPGGQPQQQPPQQQQQVPRPGTQPGGQQQQQQQAPNPSGGGGGKN